MCFHWFVRICYYSNFPQGNALSTFKCCVRRWQFSMSFSIKILSNWCDCNTANEFGHPSLLSLWQWTKRSPSLARRRPFSTLKQLNSKNKHAQRIFETNIFLLNFPIKRVPILFMPVYGISLAKVSHVFFHCSNAVFIYSAQNVGKTFSLMMSAKWDR